MQSARLFMYVMSFHVKKRVVNPHSASCNFSPRAESHLLEFALVPRFVRFARRVLCSTTCWMNWRWGVQHRVARIWLPGR